jgi:hypothetical protein
MPRPEQFRVARRLRYRAPVISLDWLPDRTRISIEVAVPATVEALAHKLVAVCLIGSAAKPDRSARPAPANAELLIVAEDLGPVTLHELAAGLAEPLRAGLQIRTLTRVELAGSVDVQALELAQWRDRHLLLAGSDPFAALHIAPTDLRHEIERALRTLSQRLRNRMLWCIATDQRHLDSVLREGIELLSMLAHHTLALIGEQPPPDDAGLLERFAEWAGHPIEGVAALRERLESTQPTQDPLADLEDLGALTEAACARIDTLTVG